MIAEANAAHIQFVPTIIIGEHIFDESVTEEELRGYIENKMETATVAVSIFIFNLRRYYFPLLHRLNHILLLVRQSYSYHDRYHVQSLQLVGQFVQLKLNLNVDECLKCDEQSNFNFCCLPLSATKWLVNHDFRIW